MKTETTELATGANAPHVYAAIAAITGALAMVGVGKGRTNASQGYAFRGIDDIYNALSRLLATHHLVILPRMLTRTQTERNTAKGGVLFSVVVEMEFDFVSAVDGSSHTARMCGEAMGSGDKASNKAV